MLDEASKVAATFCNQIKNIERNPDSDENYLHERLTKASGYFLPLIREIQESCMDAFGLEIDNKETKKKVNEALEDILTAIDIIFRSLESFQSRNFETERLCKIRTECNLQERKPAKGRKLRKLTPSESGKGIINEELKEKLQEWRTGRFMADNVPAFTIMHQSTLLSIASLIPQTKKELLAIKGFGEASFKKYGEEILTITAEFTSHQQFVIISPCLLM